MIVAIYGQDYKSEANSLAFKMLVDVLLDCKVDIEVSQSFLKIQSDFSHNIYNLKTFSQLSKQVDLLVTIGGDGTILRAITMVKDLDIPIVGVNTGRLGFLATIKTNLINDAIKRVLDDDFNVSNRSLLSLKLDHGTIIEPNFALNEITVSRKNTTSMITVDTHLNDEYLTSYWADGLIIATPTGSTGYSLSCGGPVISPEAQNIVLTPIAPHNLNARPLVINDTTKITLSVEGREDEFLLSLDSRIITLPKDTKLTIEKSTFTIKMVELTNNSFIDTLRKKLLWGEDSRN